MSQHIICLRNDFGELARANQRIAELLQASGLTADLIRTVNLGIEEVATNIIKYGYDDDDDEHQIEITLALSAAELNVIVSDDGREFNPLIQPEPDMAKPLEAREPGGLGIYFLPRLFEELHYRREGRKNILTLKKKIVSQATH